MSGHSKWATIKHAKAKTDAARGKTFTKIIREITTAAKIGGGDPGGNPRLRLAIEKAKEANMPNDNIKRAIEKGIGGGGTVLEEITYEGYGPGGVAIIIEVMTDNKNRALGEVRNILERHGGNLGASGSVAWMFKKKGSITYDKYAVDEEKLTLAAIDAGAEDVLTEETVFEVVTTPENFIKVRDALKAQAFTPLNAEVTMLPANTVKLGGEDAQKVLKLVNLIEELDDVQSVHANFDIPDALIEQISK